MTTIETTPRLHDLPAVCKILNVSRSSVYNEISRGKLRVIKIGKITRISAAELDRYLASLSGEAA